MKILHYSLGWPPYRTGGLTKYCLDLMLEQNNQGHEVGLLWPGRMNWNNKNITIVQRKDKFNLKNYELINPLPVSLLDGISNIDEYTKKCDKNIFIEFLKKYKPDVLHIHTFMGLYKEFIISAKLLKIKVIFTSHDYFGICPKVNLLKNNSVCESDNECEDCIKCNCNSLSINKIKILQSPIYRVLKNSYVIKKMRAKHKSKQLNNKDIQIVQNANKQEYKKLRQYYLDMFNYIDIIHFNSNLSKKIYSKYLDVSNSVVYPITHREIKDNREMKTFDGKLKITYLGPTKPYKGFNMLKNVLDEIYNETQYDFKLNIFSPTELISDYMEINDGYTYNELNNIFEDTDVLVAPSIWYETFGFTVLEALSYGVPVIVSENVGAKDIVGEYGFVINPDSESLKKILIDILLNRNLLVEKNNNIVNTFKIDKFNIENNVKQIIEKIYK